MWSSLVDADPSGQVLAAWNAKEELRKLLALARTDAARDQIAAQLYVYAKGPRVTLRAPAKSGVGRSELGVWGGWHAVGVGNSGRAWRFR